MARQVVVAPQAEAQIRTIDVWWRRNRRASPDLFSSELRDALSMLEVAPRSGKLYRRSEPKGIRRLLLPASRNHVYYLVGTEVEQKGAPTARATGARNRATPPAAVR